MPAIEQEKTIIMAEIMTPNMANFTGNIHGGHLLSLLDRVAYACASRYAGCPTVTLSVDQVFFKEPIHVGELVTCFASINYVGTTSMEVGIRVIAENLITREKRHTNTCYFTMVAVNKNGKPVGITPLILSTTKEHERFKAAQLRKQLRLEYNLKHQQNKSKKNV